MWQLIAGAIGKDVSSLMTEGLLVLVPAHLAHSAVGEAKLSDGTRLTAVDWRSNRLVDKLAKIAAGANCEPKSITELVVSLEAATSHAAALLGIVTHAANNHKIKVTNEQGQEVVRTVRDSVDKPKGKRPPPAKAAQAPVAAAKQPAVHKEPAPWRPPRTVSAATRERRAQHEALDRRVEAIGSSLRRRASSAPLAAVQERIRARLAAGTGAQESPTAHRA